jgi:hypothetical protein
MTPPPNAQAHIPSAEAGLAFIASIDTSVRSRGRGRENWERERFNICALLSYLAATAPTLFPATLTRQQSPDFVLAPGCADRPLAIEHTDAGSHDFHRRLDAESAPSMGGITERNPGQTATRSLPLFGDPRHGAVGDAPAQSWSSDMRAAFQRKQLPGKWRTAPDGAPRCMLIYDSTEQFIFVDDDEAHRIADRLLVEYSNGTVPIHCAAIVRPAGRVLWIGPAPASLIGCS